MDIRIHVGRRGVVLAALVLGLMAAGGVAYATVLDAGGVLTGCRLNSNGSLRLIDPSVSSGPLSRCTANETQVSWNEQGQPGAAGAPGKDGASPTVAQLAVGDTHCAAGGASITDAAGSVAYVCNGAAGASGKDSAPFDGTFTSPNGRFKLSVSDQGVTVVGPDSSIALPAAGGIFILGGDIETVANNATTQINHDEITQVGHNRSDSVGSDESITVSGNRTESVHGNETITIDANRTTHVGANEAVSVGASRLVHVGGALSLVSGGPMTVDGATLALNGGGGCKAAARQSDLVNAVQILTGSASVCVGG
jgi:hypothetical protein